MKKEELNEYKKQLTELYAIRGRIINSPTYLDCLNEEVLKDFMRMSTICESLLLKTISEMDYAINCYNFSKYQDDVRPLCLPDMDILQCVLGIADEAGEVVAAVKKWRRNDFGSSFKPEAKVKRNSILVKEIGDVLFYLAALCDKMGIAFENVAKDNIKKLKCRKARGVIRGSGDDR